MSEKFSVFCCILFWSRKYGRGPMTALIETNLPKMNTDQTRFDMTKHVLSYSKQIFP